MSDFNWPAQMMHKTDADRDRWRVDLTRRARQVRQNGWGDYAGVWSRGEVEAVAYLLSDDAMLAELRVEEDDVLSRWAFDLFGIEGGQEEQTASYPKTRAWFSDRRTELSC